MGWARAADQAPDAARGDSTAGGTGSVSDPPLRDARERADCYLAELIEEIGEPSPEAVAEAEAWWNGIELAMKQAGEAE